jgi:hypothetical protein
MQLIGPPYIRRLGYHGDVPREPITGIITGLGSMFASLGTAIGGLSGLGNIVVGLGVSFPLNVGLGCTTRNNR